MISDSAVSAQPYILFHNIHKSDSRAIYFLFNIYNYQIKSTETHNLSALYRLTFTRLHSFANSCTEVSVAVSHRSLPSLATSSRICQ